MNDPAEPGEIANAATQGAGWLSLRARQLRPSMILSIAAEVRRRREAGQRIVDLSVGDFDARAFPIAPELAEAISRAVREGATTYPPLEGVRELRSAIVAHAEGAHGLRVPIESVIVASGARPICFATYQCLLDPEDVVVYGAPSWSNDDFSALTNARSIIVQTAVEQGFLPTAEQLAPLLADARLLCLNSPLNPCGSAFDDDALRAIATLVVDENAARLRTGRPPLFVLYDQVYSELFLDGHRHAHPSLVAPEAAPWIITVDAISKSLAATGLRVGWGIVPPPLFASMRDILCHAGCWAPTPIQVATARFLGSEEDKLHRQRTRAEIARRMSCLLDGIDALGREGYPVDYLKPRGGLYAVIRFGLKGRRHRGVSIDSDDDIRRVLLEHAHVAVVPLTAFLAPEGTGWFRASVGAADASQLEEACRGIRSVLEDLEP